MQHVCAEGRSPAAPLSSHPATPRKLCCGFFRQPFAGTHGPQRPGGPNEQSLPVPLPLQSSNAQGVQYSSTRSLDAISNPSSCSTHLPIGHTGVRHQRNQGISDLRGSTQRSTCLPINGQIPNEAQDANQCPLNRLHGTELFGAPTLKSILLSFCGGIGGCGCVCQLQDKREPP